jgi:hypothetical protein
MACEARKYTFHPMEAVYFQGFPALAFEAPQKIHAFCKNLLPCNLAVTTVTHLSIRSPLQTMIRKFLSAIFLLAASTFAQAQMVNSPLKITKIMIDPQALSPQYSITIGPQKQAKSQQWLWVEVTFVYNPPNPNTPPLPEVTLNYYILLNDVSAQNRMGTLLTGSVTHTGIQPGPDDHHSVMLVSPQTLRQFFGAKIPPITTSCQAIGVTASVNGQLVNELSIGKGANHPQWWNNFQQGPPGLVLNKDQTPFAPLFYDYFEAIKAKSAGY